MFLLNQNRSIFNHCQTQQQQHQQMTNTNNNQQQIQQNLNHLNFPNDTKSKNAYSSVEHHHNHHHHHNSSGFEQVLAPTSMVINDKEISIEENSNSSQSTQSNLDCENKTFIDSSNHSTINSSNKNNLNSNSELHGENHETDGTLSKKVKIETNESSFNEKVEFNNLEGIDDKNIVHIKIDSNNNCVRNKNEAKILGIKSEENKNDFDNKEATSFVKSSNSSELEKNDYDQYRNEQLLIYKRYKKNENQSMGLGRMANVDKHSIESSIDDGSVKRGSNFTEGRNELIKPDLNEPDLIENNQLIKKSILTDSTLNNSSAVSS